MCYLKNFYILKILADEPRVESPRKLFIEEPIKPFVPHTSEEVIQLCHQAIELLFDQNTDFSNRLTIKCKIPNSYFTYGQQGIFYISSLIFDKFFCSFNK